MRVYPGFEHKILDLPMLLLKIKALKAQGKVIVSNNGSYDMLHLGHLLGLQEAKAQGDILVVGLNSDASVGAYKGPFRPINDECMRAHMLAGLIWVDYVCLFDETTPMDWLAQIQPQVHTNGAEYGSDCIEQPTVEAHGGRVHLLAMIEGYKTTAMINKIKAFL